MKTFNVRYIIKTEHDEFPRELPLKARTRHHAKRLLFERVRVEFSEPLEIIIVDVR